MAKLGVNVDHVATVREARKITEPDPVYAALIAEQAGADQITVHLREDRRHIKERDVLLLKKVVKTRLNLEMSVNEEIVKFALESKPDEVCIVPERREEITTEGGLDVIGNEKILKKLIPRLKGEGIVVSLFIDPDEKQLEMAKLVGADAVEIHTGRYASAKSNEISMELNRIVEVCEKTRRLGLILNAGHGLDYKNVKPIASISGMNMLNIGFSIVARSIYVGFYSAVKEMKEAIERAGSGLG